jgi:hypothetical protein
MGTGLSLRGLAYHYRNKLREYSPEVITEGSTLSLVGRYRKKLMEYIPKYHIEDTDYKNQSLVCTLDDYYVRSIPLDTDILITLLVHSGDIGQGIVRIKKLHSMCDSGKISACYDLDFYGVNIDSVLSFAHYSSTLRATKNVDCTSIIEYKVLDVSEAPLFINWYWLASSMKEKLFGV